MEILNKFGSSMTGFWWSLDDHERRRLALFGIWLTVTVMATLAEAQRAHKREELIDEILAEVERRHA